MRIHLNICYQQKKMSSCTIVSSETVWKWENYSTIAIMKFWNYLVYSFTTANRSKWIFFYVQQLAPYPKPTKIGIPRVGLASLRCAVLIIALIKSATSWFNTYEQDSLSYVLPKSLFNEKRKKSKWYLSLLEITL